MYELLYRFAERPRAAKAQHLDSVPDRTDAQPLILHMRENRSHLSQEARACLSAIGLLFVAASMGPARHGHWLVPAFSILAMAVLTVALELHGKASPAQELLELADDQHISTISNLSTAV